MSIPGPASIHTQCLFTSLPFWVPKDVERQPWEDTDGLHSPHPTMITFCNRSPVQMSRHLSSGLHRFVKDNTEVFPSETLMLILFNYGGDLAACVISNEDIKAALFLFYKANTEHGMPHLPPARATLESFERPASCKAPSFSWMRFNEPIDRGFPRARNATLAGLLGFQCQEDKARRGSAWLLSAFLGRFVMGVRTRLGGSEGMSLPPPSPAKNIPQTQLRKQS
ncbi:unnamed protein product [Rangifer tarandus platyrhynchus]|uniref:Uncharacterized protein n=1 Tax=Rangifer tarandus platyrhynchus TaxID=3082113 RepID=A0ABN9A2R8_RANTA|nr:unnamed protein product [Rangifer tarandus platyrhynchus]